MLSRTILDYFEGQTVRNLNRLLLPRYKKKLTIWKIGCFLSVFEKERVAPILKEFGNEDEIDYIVVSDGEEVGILLFC